ncbi:fused MFS/spermidine synthase [Roseovarius aestuariivivens]|uniref:fused MFS/spermidine synthase n=1 Tax=Roseovarius aestuariivivens TaxID=1888910 RepID=UPI0010817736|nr:fused MFS/spermidine synthase [Roseovarius aestuariivivens]
MQATGTTQTADRSALLIPALFIATIFLSASLLFFVQPLFTKIVLPQIGGSPAIWTTAMLFFQTTLIAGYLYAHLLTGRLPVRAQVWVHLAVWAVALVSLPLAIPAAWSFDPEGSAVWQTLLLFAAGVGLPFFALSANAPLIQFWYGRSGGPSAHDPYFLYGASNLGSLAALLGFPLVAEPLFGATSIGLGWAAGYIALGAFLLLSGFCAQGPAAIAPVADRPAAERPGMRRIAYWAFLAFIPSSLMLAVTSKISLDLGSFPLIWVVPLALYLLTFVLSFSNRRLMGETPFRIVTALVLVFMGLSFFGLLGRTLDWTSVGLLIVGFFIVALFAHRKLYEARPDAAYLTTFYLTMSVGGALGGLFNSIIAPVIFDTLLEAGVTVVLAGLLLLKLDGREMPLPRALLRGAAIGLAAAIPANLIALLVVAENWTSTVLFLLLGGVICLHVLRRDAVQLYAATVMLFAIGALHLPETSLLRDRSFFGTHIVAEEKGMRIYGNGTTVHGAQRLSDDNSARPEPLYYYHANGPMGQVMTSERAGDASSVGIVGLGVGSLACYARDHQYWQFYEIDALVDKVARTSEYFRFVNTCTPDAPTHLGDARVVLAAQEEVKYDILVIDAYSSDSVPVHLTTLEAVQLYMDRLAPDGVLVFHISNRYYRIDRPLGRAAAELGLVGRYQNYKGNASVDPGDTASVVVTLSRSKAALGDLSEDPRWEPLRNDGGRVWTDDFANLLSIMER